LNANKKDQQFVSLKNVSQLEQKHPCIEERHVSHKMFQAVSIIPREVQIGDAQRHTNNMQQNF
jgi:hypothetical protein